MAAGHVLLGFVCAVVVGGSGLPGGSGVGGKEKVLAIARAEVGVREIGQNGGKRVSEYLAYTGIEFPAPYCASFVSWCFGQAGYKEPRTAWSPALFPKDRMVVGYSSGDSSISRREAGTGSRNDKKWRDDTDLERSGKLRSKTSSAQARPGLVFGIYFSELKRVGHCGFVEVVRGEWIQTIEANTGPEGSRDGIGVFRRLRHKRTICKYSNWL